MKLVTILRDIGNEHNNQQDIFGIDGLENVSQFNSTLEMV